MEITGIYFDEYSDQLHEELVKMKPDNDKAFDHQVEPQIGLSVQKFTDAKENIFNKEQELFYRATDYRGS